MYLRLGAPDLAAAVYFKTNKKIHHLSQRLIGKIGVKTFINWTIANCQQYNYPTGEELL